MKNIFNQPNYYTELIKKVSISEENRKQFNSKSLVCLWNTKLCPANCENCFFKSNMDHDDLPDEQYQFSPYGMERFIEFVNSSNNAYLLIAGGGEPMLQKDFINKIIREAKTNRIVIVTNGIWARTYASAKKIIDELYQSYSNRKDDLEVIIRLSVDASHYKSLGFNIVDNIIKVFREYYSNDKNFQLRIHTLQDDHTLEIISNKIGSCKLVYNAPKAISDNDEVFKIMPKNATLIFEDGYSIKVGIAKLFYSNLLVDLNDFTDEIQKAIEVFDKDMSESEFDNPAILTNSDGSLGIDYWVDYNGNVTTWGNQQIDNLYNIYVDDYQDFMKGTFDNIISYSFLDKGVHYREKVIQSVNPKAVLRSKAINLRDYASCLILEEDKTRLYYAIRVIKDYLKEGILTQDDISFLPDELLEVINLSIDEINALYNISDYDIISQYLNKKSEYNHKTDWDILFTLINLGHYDVSDEHIKEAIDYYNETFYCNINDLKNIKDISNNIPYEKFHNRISFMKKEAKEFCLKN